MSHQPTCIMTGGNTGIGFQVAKKLLQTGHRVFLACRNAERGEEAAKTLGKEVDNSDMIKFMELDLNDRNSIRAFVDAFLSKGVSLNLLINNAAVYNSTPKPLTESKFDQTLFINFYGTLFLTSLLLPVLKQSAPSRIVNVNSSLYTYASLELDQLTLDPCGQFGLTPANCYPISKLRLLMASAYILKNEIAENNEVHIVNVCPGFIPTTELVRDSNFIKRFILYYIFPLFSFTSTMDQGVTRVFKACKDEIETPKSISSPFAYMYIKDSWECVGFDYSKVKELWEHATGFFEIQE